MISTIPARVAGLVLLGTIACANAAPDPEDELKAAIVLRFLQYAEWPQPLPAKGAIRVGVVGRPSFALALRHTLEGKTVDNRAIEVAELRGAPDSQCCQVIYFATGIKPELKRALTIVRSSHVLTIGEAKDFLDLGGAINLLTIDGHMGFEVSVEALDRCGVGISSRLLRFGQIRGRRKGDQG
jgi:hypothetical protein